MNTKKITLVVCICTAIMLSLAACGNSSGKHASDGSSIPKFDFGKIEWSIYSGINEGNRVVKFDYDNNSQYDIVEFDLEFKIKKGITNDEVNEYEELKEKAKNMEDKPTELTINAATTSYVKAGESYKGGDCNLDGTVQLYTDYDSYDLFEPDMMTVVYVENGKLYIAYYDYAEKKTSYDEGTKKAYEWSGSKLAKTIPRPDAKVVSVERDEKDNFDAMIYGLKDDQYKEYIKACKEKGYDKNIDDDSDWMWEADNDDGNHLELLYLSEDDTLSVYLDSSNK